MIGQTGLGNFTSAWKREQVLWRIFTLTGQMGRLVFGKVMMLLRALMNMPGLLEKEQPHLSDDH